MSSTSGPPPVAAGSLTSLLDEVIRGTPAERTAWVDALAPGTALGRYDLIREVGRGGFGVVWEARDRELGRRVAVKVVRRSGEAAPEKRLVAEAEVAARLSHPGIVTVLDVGRNERGAWLVQEFLSGQTLSSRLSSGPLPVVEALRVARKVAAALAYAHRHGVVHRDLTPSNVFLCDDGQVKLLDLGMAQAFGWQKLGGGTPDSMAPEQARELPEDERVDVYALGALVYRMATGESPFPPSTPPERRVAPRLESADLPGLGDLVERMLAPEPGDRPRDGAAVLAELDALEATLPRVTGGLPGAVRVRRRWPRRVAVGAASLALVAGASAAGWAAARRHTPTVNSIHAASSVVTSCVWEEVSHAELDVAPPGAMLRNGKLNGQGPGRVGEQPVWLQRSDWNHLFVPMGGSPDVFAVQAFFLLEPVTEGVRTASLTVFTDPEGPDPGNALHGRSLGISLAPGGAAQYRWGAFLGPQRTRMLQSGPLPTSIASGWHRIRIEGSRSGCWARASIDEVPLLVETGVCDFAGSFVMLQGSTLQWGAADVAWRNLDVLRGDARCL